MILFRVAAETDPISIDQSWWMLDPFSARLLLSVGSLLVLKRPWCNRGVRITLPIKDMDT